MLMVAGFGRMRRERYEQWIASPRPADRSNTRPSQDAILNALSQAAPSLASSCTIGCPKLKKLPSTGWGVDVAWLAFSGKLGMANNSGVSRFLGLHLPPCELGEKEAQLELYRRYLGLYGPARSIDFALWTGGRAIAPVFKALEPELAAVEIEGMPGVRHLMAEDLEELGEAPVRAPIRLLPKFDSMLLAHKDKSLFFPPGTVGKVFRPAGQIEAIVLVKGRVAGAWRTERTGKAVRVLVHPFRTLQPSEWKAVEREAHRVLAGTTTTPVECEQVEIFADAQVP